VLTLWRTNRKQCGDFPFQTLRKYGMYFPQTNIDDDLKDDDFNMSDMKYDEMENEDIFDEEKNAAEKFLTSFEKDLFFLILHFQGIQNESMIYELFDMVIECGGQIFTNLLEGIDNKAEGVHPKWYWLNVFVGIVSHKRAQLDSEYERHCSSRFIGKAHTRAIKGHLVQIVIGNGQQTPL